MRINELHNQPVQPDTYEASMAQNQLLKIGTHAVRLHGLIKDEQEMESWVAKKIDLASDYVKKVHGYMAGSKAGIYDDDGMTESKLSEEQMVRISTDVEGEWGGTLGKLLDRDDDNNVLVGFGKEAHWFKQDDVDFDLDSHGSSAEDDDVLDIEFDEDAGEGHMSKSQLYRTAKMAIELIEMINKGDDLEAWVQTKLNLAADYLQGVYHYEEYQKLNPYREELDSNTFAKHSEIVKKNIDEILARETSIDDVDTKPGMLKILGKRVNEVEKKMAKETRKKTDESGILYRAGVKKYGKAGMKAIQSAAAKGANHQEIGKIKDKHLKDEAAGVGIITKQNTTADVKPGDEYKNVKKLGLKSGAYESKLTDMLNQRLK
tara:strand:- start:10930 stop:12054 length:1125 start_codon:yes stop_codon:yes gene_type:complete